VDGCEHTFGVQYLWLEAHVSESAVPVVKDPGSIASLAAAFRRAEHDLLEQWTSSTRQAAARGSVALWGAGAKGFVIDHAMEHKLLVTDAPSGYLRCVKA
jgi:hypothetical protein